MKLNEAVNQRINELCENKFSIYKMAKVGGINKNTIYQIKSGKDVKLSTINDVCATLGISLKDFFDSNIFNEVTD